MVNKIQKVAVLGAGVMGSTLAGLIVGSGAKVLMLDIVPPKLTDEDKAKGLKKKSPEFRNKFALAGIARLQDKRMGMLFSKTQLPLIEAGNFEDDIERLAECDWILEVVTERLDIKQGVMKQVAQYRRKGSIVSTNTSGIPIASIAEGQDDEFMQHFLGTHFFNPPRFMHLFELIPNKKTLPKVIETMSEFADRCLGKGVVVAKDTPNFIANRIGCFISLEVMRLTEKYDYDIPTVDLLTGPVMGHPKSATYKTGDMVGLDVFWHVAGNVVASDVSDEERKRFETPQFMKDLIDAGAYGDKTKRGFYKKEKDENGKRKRYVYDRKKKDYVPLEKVSIPEVDEAKKSKNKYAALVYGDSEYNKFAWEVIRALLLYSAEMVPEIADDYMEIDKATHWGFNMKDGPFKTWDLIGVEKSVARMKEEGFKIPKWVEKRLKEGKTSFYTEENRRFTDYIKLEKKTPKIVDSNADANLRDLGDGVLLIEFISRGNSLSMETMEMFDKAMDVYLAKDEWKGLVIGNQGQMFSAGANLVAIAMGIDQKDWKAIEDGISAYQNTNMRLKYFGKPVVVAPFSRVLGGGAECTMHADFATASVETYMGLVEAGVGLLPGAGGNKEFLIRFSETAASNKPIDLLPKYLEAWQAVSTATLATNAFDAIDKHFLRASQTKVVMNADAIIDEAKKKVLQLDADGYMPPAPARITVLGDYGYGVAVAGLKGMTDGGFASEYDAFISKKIAWVMSGGNVLKGTVVDEQYLLDLEREAFLSLSGEERTKDRIVHMMLAGKPLRN